MSGHFGARVRRLQDSATDIHSEFGYGIRDCLVQRQGYMDARFATRVREDGVPAQSHLVRSDLDRSLEGFAVRDSGWDRLGDSCGFPRSVVDGVGSVSGARAEEDPGGRRRCDAKENVVEGHSGQGTRLVDSLPDFQVFDPRFP